MAVGMTVELFGMTEWQATLDMLAVTALAHVDEASAIVGPEAKAIMDANTPVLSGYLKSQNTLTPLPLGFELSNATDYAAPVEYGHHTRSGSFVPAQPFLTPAQEYAKTRFPEVLAALAKGG